MTRLLAVPGRVGKPEGGASLAQAARWRRCRRSKGAQPASAPAPCHRTTWTTLASTWVCRPALALLAASTVLTGCAEEANDVTCGEFAGMSTDQRRIVVRDIARENDTEGELEKLGDGDRGADLAAQGIAQRCAGEDDGATLSEVFAPDEPTTPTTPTSTG